MNPKSINLEELLASKIVSYYRVFCRDQVNGRKLQAN